MTKLIIYNEIQSLSWQSDPKEVLDILYEYIGAVIPLQLISNKLEVY